MIPKLDLKDIFELVVTLGPSNSAEFMGDMSDSQQCILLLLKSARNIAPIKMLAGAVNALSGPKNLDNLSAALRQQLSKVSSSQLQNLLEKKSSPEQNMMLWRSLTSEQLKMLAFDLESSSRFFIIRNCQEDQIKAMLNDCCTAQ